MKLAIVEDNALLREHLKILLDGEPGISVVGVYSSGEEALPGVIELPPDVFLVDLGLPGMSGIELVTKIKEKVPQLDIMVHTIFDNRETIFSAIKAGAAGYMLKGGSIREVIESLFCLHRGGSSMSPKIARAVRKEFGKQTGDQYSLVLQEKHILQGLADGLTSKEIAKRQGISRDKVHKYIKGIYGKIHSQTRVQSSS